MFDDGWCDECQCPIGIGQCDGCIAYSSSITEDFEDGIGRCLHCGKEFEDFSDLGCHHCDARHTYFGMLD